MKFGKKLTKKWDSRVTRAIFAMRLLPTGIAGGSMRGAAYCAKGRSA